jgi:predicted small metal-binding protein
LAARETAFDPAAFELDGEQAAELDSCRWDGLQPSSKLVANIRTMGISDNRLESDRPMARQIKCECGYVARGETDDEVIELLERHIRRDHPELVETETRDEMASMIEVVD